MVSFFLMKKIQIYALSILSLFLFITPVFAASSDLVARYHLNENTNNTTQDTSGNNLLGSVQNASVIAGKYGNGFDFTNGGYVRVSNNALLEPVNVSVEAWVKSPTSPGVYKYMLSKGAQTCNSASYALYTGLNGGLQFYISNGTVFTDSPDAGTGVWDGNWHYIVGSFDGSTVRLYVDGQQIGTGTPSTVGIGYNLADGNDLYLGRYNGSCIYGFNGQVDEVRIWNRVLSQTEITQHYGTNSIWTENN